ncbi:MAG: hypothetical protein KBS96_08620 [Lachnospiraceae bacterium]|nr:hypothetical protein [Candidatus Colinaster scatohippi]
MRDDLEIIDLDKELNTSKVASENATPKEDLTVTRAQAKVEELELELARLKAAKAAKEAPAKSQQEGISAKPQQGVTPTKPQQDITLQKTEKPLQENVQVSARRENMQAENLLQGSGETPVTPREAEAALIDGSGEVNPVESGIDNRKKIKTNAEAYASSEKNVADMLAEYDAIEAEDVRGRRGAKRDRFAERNAAVASKPKARPDDRKKPMTQAHESKRSEGRVAEAKRQEAQNHENKKAEGRVADAKRQEVKPHEAKQNNEARSQKVQGHEARPHDVRPHEVQGHEARPHDVRPHNARVHEEKPHEVKPHDMKNADLYENKKHDVKANHKKAEQLKNAKKHGNGAGYGGKAVASKRKKENKKGGFFSRLTGMDYIIAATGVLVLVAAILTINIYSSVKMAEEQIASFIPLGENIAGIGIAGESALLAMAEGREEETIEIEETEEYTVAEYDEKDDESEGNVTVKLKLQTVVKDLKIKFINQKTGKLIPGVPFEVEITDSAKKTITKTDDDKDGIIYIKQIASGEAKVKMLPLSGRDSYSLPTDIQTIVIKENLDYKKIDVSDEIKTEAQVNAAAEDTAQATVTEGALTDTVAWVESTKTPIDGGVSYDIVERDSLDPVPDAVKSGQTADASRGILRAASAFGEKAKEMIGEIGDFWSLKVYAEESESTEEQSTENSDTEKPSETPEPSSENGGQQDENTDSVDWSKYLTKNGIVVYIDKECTTKATYKDYGSHTEFYMKNGTTGSTAGFKYTGWQTIDGATYFFDAEGNKVTGEQVIQGAKYDFGSDGALKNGSGVLGIDVSKWNGSINWSQVKNSGISYVIIRCGYRGSTTGALIEDPTFRTNIKGAQAAGLKVGVYFFTQATDEVEAVEEASMTLNLISGYKLSYPVFLDVEGSGGRGDRIDSATRTKVINAYCQTIRNSGYSAGVYANRTWLSEKFSPGSLSGCKIWLAQYAATPTYGGSYQMWQYSSKGQVSGIKGNVDMNLSYMNY